VVAGERNSGVLFTPFLTQLARRGCRFDPPRRRTSHASSLSSSFSQLLPLSFLTLLPTHRHNTAETVAMLPSEPFHLDDMPTASDDNIAVASNMVPTRLFGLVAERRYYSSLFIGIFRHCLLSTDHERHSAMDICFISMLFTCAVSSSKSYPPKLPPPISSITACMKSCDSLSE
jgi:hypothetical protein